MAKLTKTTKTVLIAAVVLLALGAVLMALLLIKPAEKPETSSDVSSVVEEEPHVQFTDKTSDNVLSMSVENSTGTFTFDRQSRVVSSTDEEGNVSSETEYYWTSPQMMGLEPNASTVKAFINSMAGLSATDEVELGAQDLEKYGLASPEAKVSLSFDDGTSAVLCFGIQNPASASTLYFRMDGSSDVYLVSYYSAGSAFYDIRDFVSMKKTESYVTDDPDELDYLIIERRDMEEPVEIRYMYDVEEAAQDEDYIATTFNTHRFVSPVLIEVDTVKGKSVCYGIYGLTMSSCEYLEKTDEALAATGLDDPFATVTFKYGGKRRVLSLGNEIVQVTQTEDEDTPALTTVTGYYAMLDDDNGIYAIAKDSAPWYTFDIQTIMSRRPLSAYIYTVDTIDIIIPEGDFTLKITGDADEHAFTLNGEEVDDYKTRELYQCLIGSVGDEYYTGESGDTPDVTVRFNYREEYRDTFGTASDVVEFFDSGDRKNIVRVNGVTLFKVRSVYPERLRENVIALRDNGEIQLNW